MGEIKKVANERFLNALRCRPTDCTPIWMMRQAGRYLPEYRQLRQQARDFIHFCQTPSWAAEATLQPLRRYELDAAIIFSDILILPHAMGAELAFLKEEGPVFADPISERSQVDKLSHVDPTHDLDYVLEAIDRTLAGIDGRVPLIGFCGSPFTVASYLVEGRGSKQFTQIKRLAYSSPDVLHALLDKLTQASIAYLKAQIRAGVHAVMVFDTWGAISSEAFYREFSWTYLKAIVDALKRDPLCQAVPVIAFTKGAGLWLPLQADLGADALGVDWTVDLEQARLQVGPHVALQGNLDPAVLYSTPARIEAAVSAVLAQYGQGSGHVFNLGHGILPDIDPAKVQIMIDAVHRLSPAYHA